MELGTALLCGLSHLASEWWGNRTISSGLLSSNGLLRGL